ncbi:MAG: cobalt-zinc-cadmium efflux system membrane fusion protein [Candidatus Promineifilaceae bacterium]|jgi:membrane fusion protein, heavy metal efflux system
MKNNHTYHLLVSAIVLAGLPLCTQAEESIDPGRAANTIILDETAVQNLRLKTEMVEEREFETTVFAVGRIEDIPAKLHSISSRISGRAIEVNSFEGDLVKKGQVLVTVESRQPGNPPPTISLEAISDGLIIASHVLKGQPVEPDTDLLDIADRSEMWAVAKIPEQEAVNVKPGTTARIFIPAIGGQPITAILIRYGVTADRDSGTIEGVFQLKNSDGRLTPGMRAEFSIITASRPNVLAVPKTAIQGDPIKRVIYVKDFELENAFVQVPVVLGEQNDIFVEVINGLFVGDDVVTQGSYTLGFAGGESGPSLKDALDAAHGHEHNEDGSETTPEQATQKEGHEDHAHGVEGREGAPSSRWLRYYSIAVTLLALFLIQQVLNNRTSQSKA